MHYTCKSPVPVSLASLVLKITDARNLKTMKQSQCTMDLISETLIGIYSDVLCIVHKLKHKQPSIAVAHSYDPC
jgi:hypothetical protein